LSSIGCVILAYGEDRLYEPLLDQLRVGALRPEQIVLVHNPSLPDAAPLEPPHDISVIEMHRNDGYAGGMNAGIRDRLARACSHLLLLTHDTRFHEQGLELLLSASTSDYGIVGPAICWDAEVTCYGGDFASSGAARFRTSPPAATKGGIADCEWVDGSAVLIRREVIETAGGFDEGFFMYFEEMELCRRAAQAGWKIGVVPAAVAEQDHGYLHRPQLYAYLMTRNGLEFARRKAGWRGVLSALFQTAAGSVQPARAVAGPTSDPKSRRIALGRLVATARGIAAFGARQFGPPPASYFAVTGK
jgi:hypothetical protein